MIEKLRDYQREHFAGMLDLIRTRRSALDGSDCGVGKTYVALAISAAMDTVPLVVGPAGARLAWEQASHVLGVPCEFVSYQTLSHVAKAKDLINNEWVQERPWGTKGSFLQWKNPCELIIFDEVHRCGGETTKNSKLLIAAKRQCGHVLGLSATAADDPRQMKALGFMLGLHTLNGDKTGWRNWQLRNGCKPGIWGGMDLIEEKQEETFRRLHANIYPSRGRRLRKEEIPGFPKTQIEPLLIDDATGQAGAVAALLEKVVREQAEGERKKGDEVSAMEEMHRVCKQLELLAVPAWTSLVEAYLEKSKAVFFVNYVETMKQLERTLGKVCLVDTIYGGQSEKERKFILSQFQQNNIDALIVNIKALGESGSLHDPTGRIPRTTFVLPCESGRVLKQVYGRVNRDGGAFSLQFLCYFRNTVQERRVELLQAKGLRIDLLNDASLFDKPILSA